MILALFVSSCSKSSISEYEKSLVTLEFAARFADAEPHHATWTENDALAFFAQPGKPERYIYRDGNQAFVRFSSYAGYDGLYSGYCAISPATGGFPVEGRAAFSSASEGVATVFVPSTQQWNGDYPDPEANILVGVSETPKSVTVDMHAAVGYIRVGLSSDTKVHSVVLRGNRGEAIAGPAVLNSGFRTVPKLALTADGAVSDSIAVIFDGKSGNFDVIFCLPSMTFEGGLTITIRPDAAVASSGASASRASRSFRYDSPVIVARGRITDLEGMGIGTTFTEFALRSLDGRLYPAVDVLGPSIAVCVPRGVDFSALTPVFKHSGAVVKVDGSVIRSGESAVDFSSTRKFTVESADGQARTFAVSVVDFDIPVAHVVTADHTAIESRDVWIPDGRFVIQNTDGTYVDYGSTSYKGRGNASWGRPKKSYSVKFAVKPKDTGVLGLPGHKRWCLIAVQWGYLGNNVGYELARRAASYKWQPTGRYVELVLNGVHMGTYFLAEQIRVDKKRVNIKDGYLLTYDRTFNDPNRFKSTYFGMPVMVKDPDEYALTSEQFAFIQDYINNFEASLADNARFAAREYEQYFDIDAYIDMWFVWEMAGKTGSHSGADFAHPNSVWFYKDGGGKLTAGPCWDFDSYLFSNQNLLCNTCQYYGRLFKDPVFKARVKEKWPAFRAAVEQGVRPAGAAAWRSSLPIVQFIDSCYNAVSYSAVRNQEIWPWTKFKYDEEYRTIREGLPSKLDWLEQQIAGFK